jgi:hypothetical protein
MCELRSYHVTLRVVRSLSEARKGTSYSMQGGEKFGAESLVKVLPGIVR